MEKEADHGIEAQGFTRSGLVTAARCRIIAGLGAGHGGIGAPWTRARHAQGDDLAPYQQAKINWRQAEGEQITVAVIPASYFENLIALRRSSRR